ncbi:MAG: ribonuclease E activity regulator RraA [Rhodospirillales bacterium]
MGTDTNIVRTADICDAHGDAVSVCELSFHDYAARNHFHGEIVTFSTFEDNKGVRDVLDRGGRGKVLVIDGRGSARRALCGGNIAAQAEKSGWAGIVINGRIRDAHEFADLDFGVKATGTTPRRPHQDGTGKAGVPVTFGGVTFRPGEYLYADGDGVIVSEAPVHD